MITAIHIDSLRTQPNVKTVLQNTQFTAHLSDDSIINSIVIYESYFVCYTGPILLSIIMKG